MSEEQYNQTTNISCITPNCNEKFMKSEYGDQYICLQCGRNYQKKMTWIEVKS